MVRHNLKVYINRFKKYNWQELFNSLLWALIIAVIFRTFIFENFTVPTGSMIPNIRIGDYLFVNKFSYGYSRFSFPFNFAPLSGRIFFKPPERGDIIVFKGVKDPQTFYIKRLIGLPGDKIQMKKGHLYINDKAVKRSSTGQYLNYLQYNEVLPNDISYTTIHSPQANLREFPDDSIVYIVPAKHYFFMGDNRNNSTDSRFLNDIGYVPEENLVGKAVFLWWTQDLSILKLLSHLDTGRAFKVIK